MNKVQMIKAEGFTTAVTQEVIEALNSKTTKAAKNVAEKIAASEYYMIFKSEDRFTILSRFMATKEEIKTITSILKVEYIKDGTMIELKGKWLEWIKVEEIGSESDEVEVEVEETEVEAAEEMVNETSVQIPAKYADMITLVEKDADGYWAYSKKGFYFEGMKCHTAHESTKKDLLKMIRTLKPCNCEQCSN